jgi:CheY-like chemotaxis protein
MFKCQEERIEVLGVCIDGPRRTGRFEGMSFYAAPSGHRAIDLLGTTQFDFILVGVALPDMSTWDFLRHLKTTRSQQEFAVVGSPLSEQQKTTARLFGATAIFDTTPTTHQMLGLIARLREQAAARVLDGRFDGSPPVFQKD